MYIFRVFVNTTGNMPTKSEQVLQLIRQAGLLRARELVAHQLPRQYLRLLCTAGKVERTGRGLYRAVEAGLGPHHALALVAKRVPQGVVCLLSALRFHEVTTQPPFEVWLALDSKSWQPKVEYPPLRLLWFSGAALTTGIETHTIEGVSVRIYSLAKTVADCFKYRHKIGLEVALEALRETWHQRRATMDELWQCAQACRMTRVMRPYLESLT